MKKVLIISYYWAPAGGPGVQRWLKFAKYLRDFSIDPIIYTPKNPTYPITDPHIADDLPEDLTILRQNIFEPYALASLFSKKKTKTISAGIIPSKKLSFLDKFLLWVRGNLFIPDARVLWVKPSVKYLSIYIEQQHIDTIITTGPPHSMHLIGLALKTKMPSLRWIADFRDPWTNIGYHSQLRLTKRSEQKHLLLEKKVLQTVDTILVTSPTTQKEFETKTDRPIEVITNGYDQILEEKTEEHSPYFLLSHIGSLLSERNPKMLWQVLGDLSKENIHFKADLRICLAGKVSNEVVTSIKEQQLSDALELKGYLSHQEAIHLQKYSQVLLLLEINHPKTQGIIPGKLFEYMVAGRPIFAMGYEKWDVREIIEQTHTGAVVSSTDYQEIKEVILAYYQLYKEHKLSVKAVSLSSFHRRALTERLSKVIFNSML